MHLAQQYKSWLYDSERQQNHLSIKSYLSLQANVYTGNQ